MRKNMIFLVEKPVVEKIFWEKIFLGLRGLFLLLFFFINPLLAAPDLGEDFESYISSLMEETQTPGLAIAILKEGKVIFEKGFGYRDPDKKLPVTPHTLFAIGSTTKAMTATALGILVDEKKLDLDIPAKSYLPSLKLYDLFATEKVTLRDMLLHRTGIPRHDLMWYGSLFSREELIDRLHYLENSADFRTAWQYNNLMYVTAGYVGGKIFGSDWEGLVQTKIFDPLGMTETNFSITESQKRDNFALPHGLGENGHLVQIPFRNIDAAGPAGSVNSNLIDMTKWLNLQLSHGSFNGNQIISKETLRDIHRPQILVGDSSFEELPIQMYGLGWLVAQYRNHWVNFHSGAIDGFITNISFMPEEKIGIIVFANIRPSDLPEIITFEVYDRLLGLDKIDWKKRFDEVPDSGHCHNKDMEDKEKPLTRPPSDYLGIYEHPGYGKLKIEIFEGKIFLIFNALAFEIRRLGDEICRPAIPSFFKKFGAIRFGNDERGNISSVSALLECGVAPIVFQKRKVELY